MLQLHAPSVLRRSSGSRRLTVSAAQPDERKQPQRGPKTGGRGGGGGGEGRGKVRSAAKQGEVQRLAKVLAAAGVASRRACEDLISQGMVKVNGAVVKEQVGTTDVRAQTPGHVEKLGIYASRMGRCWRV